MVTIRSSMYPVDSLAACLAKRRPERKQRKLANVISKVRFPVDLMSVVWLGLVFLFWGTSTALARVPLTEDGEVRRFIDEMVVRHNYEREDLVRLLEGAKILPRVLEAVSRPWEAKPWYQYRPIFVNPSRIREGLKFWDAHRDVLRRVEADYGVRPEIIVAIIGVETLYGQHTGSYRVLDSLATLAFRYPKRSSFFRGELEHFLLLVQEEGLDPRVVKGSYAGAMGLPQFISSSYRRYAVDSDGDKVRDLFTSPMDAIGSVANYLKVHGWRRGGDVALRATLQGDAPGELLQRGIKPHTTLGDIGSSGVSVQGNAQADEKAALIRLATKDGFEYWVGLQNFYTITRYNHSPLYAMAVYQLAEAIRQRSQAAGDS